MADEQNRILTGEPYANVRELLGALIGRRVLDVTQQDEADWLAGDEAHVMIMFDDGSWVRVYPDRDGRILIVGGPASW